MNTESIEYKRLREAVDVVKSLAKERQRVSEADKRLWQLWEEYIKSECKIVEDGKL